MEGDPKYLAPELLQGRFGKPADIFRCKLCCIGVIFVHWSHLFNFFIYKYF